MFTLDVPQDKIQYVFLKHTDIYNVQTFMNIIK